MDVDESGCYFRKIGSLTGTGFVSRTMEVKVESQWWLGVVCSCSSGAEKCSQMFLRLWWPVLNSISRKATGCQDLPKTLSLNKIIQVTIHDTIKHSLL